MGVRKTTDFLEKSTWTLAIALLVLSLVASLAIPKQAEIDNRSAIEEQIRNAVDPTTVPEFPTNLPQNPSSNNTGTPEQK